MRIFFTGIFKSNLNLLNSVIPTEIEVMIINEVSIYRSQREF